MQKGLIYAAGWAGLAIVGVLALTHIKPGPGAGPAVALTEDSASIAPDSEADRDAAASAIADASASALAVASASSASALSASASATSASSASSSSASASAASAAAPTVAVREPPRKPLDRAGRRCQDRVSAIIARQGVQYTFDAYELTPQGRRTMRDVYRVLSRCPSPVRLTITGYTDSVGSPAVNRQISAGRAVAAMNALTSYGWPASKVTAVGKGSADPIASNSTFAGRKKNRRVVFTLSSAR